VVCGNGHLEKNVVANNTVTNQEDNLVTLTRRQPFHIVASAMHHTNTVADPDLPQGNAYRWPQNSTGNLDIY